MAWFVRAGVKLQMQPKDIFQHEESEVEKASFMKEF
jgi:hypothetical protein